MIGSNKVSKSQFWILQRLAEGAQVVPSGGYEVHTSFATGETHYGAPKQAYEACIRKGFIDGGVITEFGLATISKALGANLTP